MADEKLFLDNLHSLSKLFRALSEYISNYAEIELKNPQLKKFNEELQKNPEKLTQVLEEIYDQDDELGSNIMMIIIHVSALNTKLATLNLMDYEQKKILVRELDKLSERIDSLEKHSGIKVKIPKAPMKKGV